MSLLISSIMLGKQGTSLGSIIRTTIRKQELKMLVGELTRARSSNVPEALLTRARRATELGEPGTELVSRPLPSQVVRLLVRLHRECHRQTVALVDSSAGGGPAKDELATASSVKLDIACHPAHTVRFVPQASALVTVALQLRHSCFLRLGHSGSFLCRETPVCGSDSSPRARERISSKLQKRRRTAVAASREFSKWTWKQLS